MKVYNTLSRKIETFKPIDSKEVRMYTCGPTVYNYAHIGNLRSFIFADILKRVLQYNGYKVKHVMNITDVGHLTTDADSGEDKMEKGAKREGLSVWDIAKRYTDAFMNDIHSLNIIDPTIICKATDHIKEQVAMVKTLEKKGFTYATEDGVYFDTSHLKDYGKLAKLNLEGLQAGARVEVGGKKNPTDFALWKFSPKDEQRAMEWESPWGVGFPGWHIECSAMSTKYLGEQFDIHTGGIDHIPVHHTNEIAQSECCYDKKPWVKYWMHNEFLLVGKDKMAKSGENFLTLSVLKEKGYSPLDYRYFTLTASYRQQLNFTFEGLDSAKNTLERLRNIIAKLQSEQSDGGFVEEYKKKFLLAINDDLNMPKALSVMWELVRDEELGSVQKLDLLYDFDVVFGLGIKNWKKESVDVSQDVLTLIEQRQQARSDKNWSEADRLRDEIQSKGFLVKDTKDGYEVSKL